MIDRTWYLNRLSRALNAVHMCAVLVLEDGLSPQESKYFARMELFGQFLRDEIQVVLQNEDISSFVDRLEQFLDGMLDLWISSLESNMPYDEFKITAVFVDKINSALTDDTVNDQ